MTVVSHAQLFIDYVNVLFSSNSQLLIAFCRRFQRCLSIMSMFSFQAIHNDNMTDVMTLAVVYRLCQCSLFKQFTTAQAPPRRKEQLFIDYVNVLFSSNSQLNALFKQFTTCRKLKPHNTKLFIDYVNVLFSSNSQRTISFYFSMQRYIFFRTVPNLFFKELKNKHFTF